MREIKWYAFIGLIGATLLFCLGPFKKIEAVQKRTTRWSATDSLLEGDIVFQTLLSGQGLAIKRVTSKIWG